MTDSPERPPEWVAGRFRLTDLLGTGGSASVYRADDAVTGQTVAVKILHPHLTERDAARAFFLAEASRARELQHPHIVRIVDVGTDASGSAPVVWIAAEYVPGRTLAEHVRVRGPLSPADAARVADAVLDALVHAHERGLVHRDVTPSNIMFATDETGRVDAASVRLLDFGIADRAGQAAVGEKALLGGDDSTVGVIGNARYLSPEQAQGQPVDERGDVYQVGAVLYFALVGRAPFVRASAAEVAAAHVSSPPPVPSTVLPTVPRAFDRIVVRAMLKSPDDRFPRAAAMRAALREALGEGVPDPVPGPERTEVQEPVASDRTGVTRVLGATRATGRMPERAGGFAAPMSPAARRGGGILALALGITLLVGIGVAVASSPTASVTAATATPAPQPTPTPTPTPTVQSEIVDTVAVPDLAGHPRAGAQVDLVGMGLVVGELVIVDSSSPPDLVLSSDPAAGTRVPPGTVIELTVASGFATIPAVEGLTATSAEEVLRAAGFVPNLSAPTAGAIVSRVEPAAGTRAAVGTSILIIATAPSPTPTPTPTPQPPTPSPQPTAPTPTAIPTGTP